MKLPVVNQDNTQLYGIIIKPKHRNVSLSKLEEGGAKMKLPMVNQDNIQLYGIVKTTYEGTPWWFHGRKAQRGKDGRRALILMGASLMSSNAADEANTKNRRDLLALEYKSETKGWGLLKYVSGMKKCHADQSTLHISYNFPDFTEREKVTALIDGIKTDKYDIPVVNIQNDTFGARINFDRANEMLIEYKAITDGRDRLLRTISHIEGGGAGVVAAVDVMAEDAAVAAAEARDEGAAAALMAADRTAPTAPSTETL